MKKKNKTHDHIDRCKNNLQQNLTPIYDTNFQQSRDKEKNTDLKGK